MSGDDTQDPRTEPGNQNTSAVRFVQSVEPDTLPPIVVGLSHGDGCDAFTSIPNGSPYPPSGICLVGDGLSWSSTTRPNAEPIIGGLDNVRHARITGICEQLRDNPWKLERIETLLGILVTDPSVRERLGAIAVKLGSSPGLIENAEQLIAMGS